MTPDQKFEILKTELALIQATLDKYDDLIFRSRNFFTTLWLASLGLSFTIKSTTAPLLAVVLSVFYWFLEGMMRYKYWLKYVDRYRFLRNQINQPEFNIENISIYDLTNHFHPTRRSWWKRTRTCFFRTEPIALYGGMGCAALMLWFFLSNNILKFPPLG